MASNRGAVRCKLLGGFEFFGALSDTVSSEQKSPESMVSFRILWLQVRSPLCELLAFRQPVRFQIDPRQFQQRADMLRRYFQFSPKLPLRIFLFTLEAPQGAHVIVDVGSLVILRQQAQGKFIRARKVIRRQSSVDSAVAREPHHLALLRRIIPRKTSHSE
jgi:hypothetical protein